MCLTWAGSRSSSRNRVSAVGAADVAAARGTQGVSAAWRRLEAADEAQLLEALAAHPALLERPVVINGDRARIGRPPEAVLEAVVRLHAPVCGLSALMTTTVPAMRETIELIHREAPWCKVMVGGAVLTEAYAREIEADGYARDAMAAVRCAETLTGG